MENKRHGLRAKCRDKCVLVFSGSRYECILEDISISGALIRLDEQISEIRPGKRCGLHLCNDPKVCPGEYACQVTRTITQAVGVRFIHMS